MDQLSIDTDTLPGEILRRFEPIEYRLLDTVLATMNRLIEDGLIHWVLISNIYDDEEPRNFRFPVNEEFMLKFGLQDGQLLNDKSTINVIVDDGVAFINDLKRRAELLFGSLEDILPTRH